MTIVLDLDDVLANLRESLYQTLLRSHGVDRHWRHWGHYDLTRHYQIGNAELDALLIREGALEACEPEPGAAQMTHAIAELGFELAIVTARGWHPRGEAVTRAWLDAQGIHFDHLAVVALGGNKLDALKPFAKVELAVDDFPANIKRYHGAGIPALMVDRPWNAHFTEAERIHSLDAVLQRARKLRAVSPAP